MSGRQGVAVQGGQSSAVRYTPSVAGHFRAAQAGHREATLQNTQGASWPSSAWRAGGQGMAMQRAQGASWRCLAQRSELSKAMRLSTLCLAQRGRALSAVQGAAFPSSAGAHSGARQGGQRFATLSASAPGAPRAFHADAGLPVQSSSVRCAGTLSRAELRAHRGPRPGNAHGPKQSYALHGAA